MNRYTYTLENVKEAIQYLKSGSGSKPSFLEEEGFEVKEGQLYRGSQLVVPRELREELLRKILITDPGGPMGRDSVYHYIQPSFIGIPRSYVQDFLSRQKVFQMVKPYQRSEQKLRGSIYHSKLGVVETDLVHLRANDAPFWLKRGSKDRFFVVVCCVMTGFTVVRLSESKLPEDMIKHFKKLFPKIEKYFPITTLRSDSGGEFKNSKMADWLKTQGIKQKFVPLASMVENRNRLFQRAFFTRARVFKGKLYSAIASAEQTVNNTLNRKTGLTPLQAITKTSSELRKLRSDKRHTKPGIKRGPIRFKKGDSVRPISISRKDKAVGYKSYKAKHWGPAVEVEAETRRGKAYKYKLSSGEWRWADELRKAGKTDITSSNMEDSREYYQDDTYFGKDDEEYIPKKPKKSKKPKKPKKLPDVKRRSTRLRGKRVDYKALERKYDFLG